jgi:hypothetical protein
LQFKEKAGCGSDCSFVVNDEDSIGHVPPLEVTAKTLESTEPVLQLHQSVLGMPLVMRIGGPASKVALLKAKGETNYARRLRLHCFDVHALRF